MTVFGRHAATGSPHLYSRSTGSVFFTPGVDSLITITGNYDHILAGGDRMATLRSSLIDIEPVDVIDGDAQDAAPIFGDPPVGSLAIAYEHLLIAGRSYAFTYAMQIDSFSGSPNILATGEGAIDIAIAPVPEPATLTLLALTLPVIALRRRKQCH